MTGEEKLLMAQIEGEVSIPDERSDESTGFVQSYEGNGKYSILTNGKIILMSPIQRTSVPIGAYVTITPQGFDYL
jgi:hypothetical protein